MWGYLLDVVVLLGGAMLVGAVFERFRQSAIIGYLLAGTLLGPHALDVIQNQDAMQSIAEIGVALLLFSIGLEFSWHRLREFGRSAVVSGGLQIGITMAAAAGVALLFGLSLAAAVAIGAVVALSSTAVVLRTLADRGEIDSVHGRTALGVLLVQDVAVVPLVLLIETLGGEGSAGQVAWDVGRDLLYGTLMVAGFALIARYVLPAVVAHPAISKNRELPILFAIVTAAGSAWVSQYLGLSAALGAFVAGVIIAGSPLATQVRADVGPLKTVFVTLFFAAIGMLADLEWLVMNIPLVFAVLAAVILGKAAIMWGVARVIRLPHRQAISSGATLAQVGEFSFVLATLAWGTGLVSEDVFRLLVTVTIGSLFATPYLIAGAAPAGAWIERRLRKAGMVPPHDATTEPPPERGHVVIVGFGPAGQTVAQGIQSAGLPITVIELNPRTVLQAKSEGLSAIAGDASMPEVVEHAHAPTAKAIVVTLPDQRAAAATIEQFRAHCPNVPIIARARYHAHVGSLRIAGAQVAVDEEATVGQRLAEEVQRTL